MKNIAKKIATVALAFALALGSVFAYNPLVANATSSSDLALDFVNEVTVTKPYMIAVSYKEDLVNTYAVTEIVIEANQPMRFYANGTNFTGLIFVSNGWTAFPNLRAYTDKFSKSGANLLMYRTSTYNTTTNQLISEDVHGGFDPFGYSNFEFATVSGNAPEIIVSNEYVYADQSSATNESANYAANSIKTNQNNSAIHSFDDYGAKTSTAPSSYTADASLIGEGVLVSVPAVMDLSYSEQSDAYVASDYISAKGHVLDIAEVVVSTSKTAEYSLLDTNKTYEATVSFGSDMGETNVAIWSAADLNAGYADANAVVKKPIAVSLPGGDLEWAGDYKSVMEVDVSYNVVGLYRDLCESSNGQIQTSDINDYAASLSNTNSLTEINLENSISRINTTTLCKGSADATVEKIQLGSKMNSGQDFHYEGVVNTSNPLEVYSWIMGYENLQLVVVPGEVTKDTFFAGYNRFSNRHFDTTNDNGYTSTNYAGQYFTGTDIEIGNAICFVKGVTDGGYYEYVPYIVFRGTMDEWKAIPGNGDWVFGNAANTVTVQCTDGRLLYN